VVAVSLKKKKKKEINKTTEKKDRQDTPTSIPTNDLPRDVLEEKKSFNEGGDDASLSLDNDEFFDDLDTKAFLDNYREQRFKEIQKQLHSLLLLSC